MTSTRSRGRRARPAACGAAACGPSSCPTSSPRRTPAPISSARRCGWRRPTRCARCATCGGPTGRSKGKSEAECLDRTVRHYRALERLFDKTRPDVVVPEVGSETFRTAAHQIAVQRGIDVLFLFYTIFPRPLRLYSNTMHAPIVAPEDVRALGPAERDEVERFIAEFTAADRPIRAYRQPRVTARTLRDFARQVAGQLTVDRANEYVRPRRYLENYVRERTRGALASRLYEPLSEGDRPVRVLPAARHRRLQDQARDPALRGPGVDHRAHRRVAPPGRGPGAQGAPDVDRPQSALPAAPAGAQRERPARRPVHELARAHPPRPGGRRHLVDRRPRGAAARPSGPDGRAALLRRLRRDRRRRLVPRDPRRHAGAAPLHPRPGDHAALPARRDAALLPRQAGHGRRVATRTPARSPPRCTPPSSRRRTTRGSCPAGTEATGTG